MENARRIGFEWAIQVQNRYMNLRQFFDDIETELKAINKTVTHEARRMYYEFFIELDSLNGDNINVTIENLNKLSTLMSRLDSIHKSYRKKYGQVVHWLRQKMYNQLRNDAHLSSIQLMDAEIKYPLWSLSQESKSILDAFHNSTLKSINSLIEQWRNYVYDTFMSNVVRQMRLSDFIEKFVSNDDKIFIGNKKYLSPQILFATTERLLTERSVAGKLWAQESGLDECFNINPVNIRTKPQCISATLAGVISNETMVLSFGLPPRKLCRCSLVYTNSEWKDINAGINDAIEAIRLNAASFANVEKISPKVSSVIKRIVPDIDGGRDLNDALIEQLSFLQIKQGVEKIWQN